MTIPEGHYTITKTWADTDVDHGPCTGAYIAELDMTFYSYHLCPAGNMRVSFHAGNQSPPDSWRRRSNIQYAGKAVVGLFLWSDINSPADPNDMKAHRDYYELPNTPWADLSATLLRDLIDTINFVDKRVGAPQFVIYAELRGQHDLVRVDDYNLFSDI